MGTISGWTNDEHSPQIAQMGTDEYIHKELTEDIVGAAMTVLNKLRPGLKEKAWKRVIR